MSYPSLFVLGKQDWSRFTGTSLHKEGLEAWGLKLQLSQELAETVTPFSSSDGTGKSPRFL